MARVANRNTYGVGLGADGIETRVLYEAGDDIPDHMTVEAHAVDTTESAPEEPPKRRGKAAEASED